MKIKSTNKSDYFGLLFLLVFLWCQILQANDEKSAFFEQKIRPVLAEHCYDCHSAIAKSVKGGLLLDTKKGLATGGSTGPVIKAGDPENSSLYLALKYEGDVAEMPPRGKLAAAVIDDFRRWIADGAVDPRSDSPLSQKISESWSTAFEKRLDWWSFKPLTRPKVPQNAEPNPIDAFLLEKLEENNLTFARPADKATLLRRVSLDLTGLPPTEAEIQAFLADDSSDAYEKQVDRILASPHYGERVARRWMDLTHYTETVGSEQDALIPYSWAYRDYLIKAFNSDIPYSQLVREHIAGDLVEKPRRDATTGLLQSPVGTSWMRFVEFYHSPVDVKNEEAVVIENQIDTLGKTFLGLTVACARCHDHKFDPIGTDDYYKLYGIFRSARATVHSLADPERLKSPINNADVARREVVSAAKNQWQIDLNSISRNIEIAFQTPEKADPKILDYLKTQLDSPRRWGYAFAMAFESLKLKKDPAEAWQNAWKAVADSGQPSWQKPGSKQKLLADFTKQGSFPADWSRRSFFTPEFSHAGTFHLSGKPEPAFGAIRPSGFHSDAISEKLSATLRSPEMKLSGGTYSVLASGSAGARLRLVVDNFQGVDILFAGATPVLNQPKPNWYKLGVRDIWKNQEAYIEIATREDMPSAGVIRDLNQIPRDGRSSAGIRYVVFHENPDEIVAEESPSHELMQSTGDLLKFKPDSKKLGERLIREIRSAISNFNTNQMTNHQASLIQDLLDAKILTNRMTPGSPLENAVKKYRTAEEQIDLSARCVGVAETTPAKDAQPVFIRGDHRKHGNTITPGDLKLNQPWQQSWEQPKMARLALAESWASEDQPLVWRVIANRIWGWYFGRGVFATVDNLGHLGEPPSHPELLDWLAREFQHRDGSIKSLSRFIVTSRAYRQSSMATGKANEIDPNNLYLSHATVRRIDAESLRDAVLTASGSIDRTLYGLPLPTPQPPGLTDDKKPVSGPVDGNGRRTIYLNVRKNFPIEFLEIFDRPRPTLTVGRRNVSNQPSQALALLNDPFVRGEAERLGKTMQNETSIAISHRIESLYLRIFGRLPDQNEIKRAEKYISENSWAELVAALFCTKEFIFVR